MKSSRRAERRHHNARLLKKRFKQEVRNLYLSHDSDREEELNWCMHRAKRRLSTNVNCSCAMCGNPRRYHGLNSWNALTFQEIRANDAQADGLEEFVEKSLTAMDS